MILLMVLTQLYGVAQLALLGWVARVMRLRVLLLAALAGTYAAAPAALLLEAGWTRAVAALSGQSLVEASARASWTVDPLIEECAKLAPLLLLWLLVRSPRRQWGSTDLVLGGAALGAGFGLAEQLLRFAAHAGQAVHLDTGGWAIPAGPASVGVPGVARALGSWLPAGVATGGLPDGAGSLDLHLVWSAVAGLGLALALRRGAGARPRLAGLALIALAVADHAAANAQGVAGSLVRMLATPFTTVRPLAWAWPLAALAAAIWLDRQRPPPDVVLACERRRQPRSLGLARLALSRPPWSLQAVWGFVRLRRAWRRSSRWGEPDLALGEALDLLAPALDRASGWKGSRIWRAATRRLRRQAARAGLPAPAELLTTAHGLLAVAWLLLLLPPVLYLLVGGVPSLAGVQRVMGKPPLWWLVIAAAVAGAAWIAWSLAVALRRLPQARRHPAAEVPATATLLLLVRAGALVASLAALWLLALGDAPGDPLRPSAHILDAGGQATLLLVLLLALAANAAAPPLAQAPAGGGEAAIGKAVVAAVVGGIGVALLDDDDGDGDGAAASRQPVPGLPYSAGELARLAERHAGAIGRPTHEEIERAIASAAPRPVRGHNAVRFDDQGITVVVDRDLPWRSTAWFAGR
jgi:RsiW-degrading membrane proteinase PrsW (M82 family)